MTRHATAKVGHAGARARRTGAEGRRVGRWRRGMQGAGCKARRGRQGTDVKRPYAGGGGSVGAQVGTRSNGQVA